MPKRDKPFEDGPSQVYPAPDRLQAQVVDWRDGGAIHGIGVLDDLAVHYAPHEVLLLGLTGAAPSSIHGRAFGVALTWICASHVGTAPTHSAVLARVSGSPTANLVGIAAMVAGREADDLLNRNHALLEWLDSSPRCDFDGWDHRDPQWRRRLSKAAELDLPELELARDPGSAALIVFHAVGIRQRARIISAWAWSRMIGSLAESLNDSPLDLRTYPLRLPAFDYSEEP